MIATALLLIRDMQHFLVSACTSHTRLAAENLLLRKQLAFFVERKVKPRRLNDAARIVVLTRVIEWRPLLVVVRPETLVRWHRQGFRLFWSWTSRRPGRPRIPVSLQNLIADMARANQTWVRNGLPTNGCSNWASSSRRGRLDATCGGPCRRASSSSQTWGMFLRNHACETLACDFFVAVTATFRLVFVFLVLVIGTRRILH